MKSTGESNSFARVQRPVQLIIAGKAHPADHGGQALIQEWVRFIRQPEMRPHAIFLSDYNTQVSATRPATEYTPRIIPHCDGVAIPLEETRILWQR